MKVSFVLHSRSGAVVERYDVNLSVHTASSLSTAKRLFFPNGPDGLILLADNFDVDVGVSSDEDFLFVNLRPPFMIESSSGESRKLKKAEEEQVAVVCLSQSLGRRKA